MLVSDDRQPAANLQISIEGQTTSLGDYDTQEAAAAAFDRAAINRDGAGAATNFNMVDYAGEMHVWEGAACAADRHAHCTDTWLAPSQTDDTDAHLKLGVLVTCWALECLHLHHCCRAEVHRDGGRAPSTSEGTQGSGQRRPLRRLLEAHEGAVARTDSNAQQAGEDAASPAAQPRPEAAKLIGR